MTIPADKAFKIQYTYLAWYKPGKKEEEGRVALVPARKVQEPEPLMARTAEKVTIPAGRVLRYLVEEEPPQ